MSYICRICTDAGHEHPFSILLSHISQQLHGAGDNSVQNAPVQFLVRRKQAQGENSTGQLLIIHIASFSTL